ncbi:MAG: Protein serine/threonine phosphatase PrpC, regulation of stationary phase, partial [uncultured Thermomicrobiales bacterium]
GPGDGRDDRTTVEDLRWRRDRHRGASRQRGRGPGRRPARGGDRRGCGAGGGADGRRRRHGWPPQGRGGEPPGDRYPPGDGRQRRRARHGPDAEAGVSEGQRRHLRQRAGRRHRRDHGHDPGGRRDARQVRDHRQRRRQPRLPRPRQPADPDHPGSHARRRAGGAGDDQPRAGEGQPAPPHHHPRPRPPAEAGPEDAEHLRTDDAAGRPAGALQRRLQRRGRRGGLRPRPARGRAGLRRAAPDRPRQGAGDKRQRLGGGGQVHAGDGGTGASYGDRGRRRRAGWARRSPAGLARGDRLHRGRPADPDARV